MNFFKTLLFILISFSSYHAFSAQEIKLCYENVVIFPWIMGDEKGLVITEVRLIEKKLGLKFNLIRLPWKRCQYEAQAGKLDGLIATSFTEERAKYGVYPTKSDGGPDEYYRLHTDSFNIYKRIDSSVLWKDNRFLNLSNNQIGVQLGYSVGDDLKKMGHSIHDSFTTPYDLLKQLDLNAISVAVLQTQETERVLNEHPKLRKSIVRLDPPFKVKAQYLFFTKKFYYQNKELTHSIWKSVAKARESKAYKKEALILIGNKKAAL